MEKPSGPDRAEVAAETASESAARRVRKRTVRNFPASSFEEALSFAVSLYDFGSGQPVRRLSLFNHLGKAPESGPSRQAITNASRYGLIIGSYTSELLELSEEGRRLVNEATQPREKARLKVKLAIEDVEPFADFTENSSVADCHQKQRCWMRSKNSTSAKTRQKRRSTRSL